MTTYLPKTPAALSEIYHEEVFVFQHFKKLVEEHLEQEDKADWAIYAMNPMECGRENWTAIHVVLNEEFDCIKEIDPDVMVINYSGEFTWRGFGYFHSKQHEVIVVRLLMNYDADPYVVNFITAPTHEKARDFVEYCNKYQIRKNIGKWITLTGTEGNIKEVEVTEELRETDAPILNEGQEVLLNQIKIFFGQETRNMYQKLKLPYRMGCLLYGHPGTGKTNFIRSLGQELEGVTFLNFRTNSCTDNDDLDNVNRTWCESSPSILVIEDIDVLFTNSDISLSHFLNTLDGLNNGNNGNLIIGTTNHPEKLEASVLNRPGRFDELVLFPVPAEEERRRFYAERLTFSEFDLNCLVKASDQLTYADMNHSLLNSGFRSVQEGRDQRNLDDLLWAVDMIKEKHDDISGKFREMDGCNKFFGFCPQQD